MSDSSGQPSYEIENVFCKRCRDAHGFAVRSTSNPASEAEMYWGLCKETGEPQFFSNEAVAAARYLYQAAHEQPSGESEPPSGGLSVAWGCLVLLVIAFLMSMLVSCGAPA